MISSRSPEGRGSFTRWRLQRTLASQLEEIGVKPADMKFIAASHTHFDHIGNVDLFPQSMLLMQKAEYQWPMPQGRPALQAGASGHPARGRSRRVRRRLGGAARDAGAHARAPVVPAAAEEHRADPVHRRRRAFPGELGFPAGADRSTPTASSRWQSMERLAAIVASTKAQLWIHHDKPQNEGQKNVAGVLRLRFGCASKKKRPRPSGRRRFSKGRQSPYFSTSIPASARSLKPPPLNTFV